MEPRWGCGTRKLGAWMMIDDLILGFDRALRTLSGVVASGRANPAAGMAEPELTPEERRHAAGLKRGNHTREVCAPALYQAPALRPRQNQTRPPPGPAAHSEGQQLAWS